MKKPAKKPDTAQPVGSTSIVQRVKSLNRWRDSLNPLRGLTLPRAVAASEAYFRGEMADLQWLYFFIEQTDADLLALTELRIGRLLEMEYNIKVAKDADETLGNKQAEFLREKFDGIDNLYEAIEHLGMAAFRGFSHCEKWVNADGDLYHLEIVDQWNCVRDGLVGGWKYNPEARSTTFDGLPDGQLMPPDRFLYREVRRPINRVALFKFIRGGLAEKDWDAFVEIYGIPGGVLIGPPDLSEDKQAEFASAAKDIAEGGSGYAPNGSDWKPNTAARGAQPFKERLDYLSEKLVLAGTGGKLTMLNGPTGLGGGQSDVHAEVFASLAAAEARRISEVFNQQLVAAWLEEGFPGQPAVAYFELAANQEADTGEIIAEIKTLSEAGYQVDLDEASERTGYKLTLKPQAPGFQPSGTGSPIANRATPAAVAKDSIFKANATAQQLAARREVFRPIAERLAALAAIDDPGQRRQAALALQADSAALFKAVIDRAPDLARPAEEAIGTALIDGFSESAAAKADGGPAK